MAEHLRGCLRSIERQKTPWPLATVVVHLRTEEDPGEWIGQEFPWVRMEWASRFGISHMRNIGLRAVDDAPHAMTLDADARLGAGALEALVRFAEETPRAAMVAPRTLRPDGSLEYNAKRFYDWTTVAVRRSPLRKLWPGNPWSRWHLMLDQDHSRPFDCDWAAGACMLLAAAARREIGEFDERFTFGFEDVDWCYRAIQAGWRVCYCPAASIEHHVQRLSAGGFNAMTREHLKSLWRFWRKHGRLNIKKRHAQNG